MCLMERSDIDKQIVDFIKNGRLAEKRLPVTEARLIKEYFILLFRALTWRDKVLQVDGYS